MNKVNEIKKVLKPIIKECIKEILYEEGLTKLVKENVAVTTKPVSKPVSQQNYQVKEKQFLERKPVDQKKILEEKKKKLLDEIGMSGFDPFVGTQLTEEEIAPVEMHEQDSKRMYEGIEGSGIDISRLLTTNKKSWNFFNNAMNNSKKE